MLKNTFLKTNKGIKEIDNQFKLTAYTTQIRDKMTTNKERWVLLKHLALQLEYIVTQGIKTIKTKFILCESKTNFFF